MIHRQAAKTLGLSRRQVQRLKKREGKRSPRRTPWKQRPQTPSSLSPELKDRVARLVKANYFDFNFCHLSEILAAEEDLCINGETLRRWLRPLGFGGKLRKRRTHRKRRKRSTQQGQMFLLDSSPHQRFGSKPSPLILCADDATGKPLYGLFQGQEDLNGCLRVCQCRKVFTTCLPESIYLDRASHSITACHGGLHRFHRDDQPTQFERAMDELGIGLILSHSSQPRARA